jgi:hypothetical protein
MGETIGFAVVQAPRSCKNQAGHETGGPVPLVQRDVPARLTSKRQIGVRLANVFESFACPAVWIVWDCYHHAGAGDWREHRHLQRR